MADCCYSTAPEEGRKEGERERKRESRRSGVLAIAWSLADPELLLSCGKDSRILCWNPNTGEVLYELPTSSQWCFDIQWCPRNPAVLSAAGFDGHIDIYSIMGGSNQAQSQRHADQISNSFGNMDPFGTGQSLPPLQLPQTAAPSTTVTPLKKPPKWIRRPVGASFAFGGKLVSLENAKPNPQQPQQPTAHVVHISQVVTETAFLKRSDQLQATLSSGSFVDFCQEKIDAAENEFEKTLWSFLKANFESDIRSKYLELLGYNKEELALKISAALEEKPAEPPQVEVPAPAAPQPLPDLSLVPPADTPEAAFDMIAAANLQPEATLELDSTPDQEAEEPPAAEEEPEDAPTGEPEENPDLVLTDEEAEGEEIPLEEETAAPVEEEEEEEEPGPAETSAPVEEPIDAPGLTPAPAPAPAPTPTGVSLSISQDVDGLITQALLTGDFEGAVELCLRDNRMADSIILAIAGGAELLEKTQKKYFTKTHSKITKLISAVVMKDWHDILKTCDLQNWKEALAAVMTYAQPEEFSSLCDLLGARLEAADDPRLQAQACLCYICAGNVEKLVACWTRAQDGHCPLSLQDLVEKVVVLRRAVEQTQRSGPAAIGILLAEKMTIIGVCRVCLCVLQVRAASTVTSWSNQTPTALPNVPPPPLQVGSASEQQVEPPNPMYGMLPSGSAAAPPPSSTPAYMFSHQYQPYPQVSQYPPGAGGVSIYQPLQYSSAGPPAEPPGFLSQYTQPISSPVYPGQPPISQCLSSSPPSHPHFFPTSSSSASSASSSFSAPPSSGASFQHGGPGSPVSYMPPPPPLCGVSGPQNGWNDPPALSRATKKKPTRENYTPPAPITAPIMAPLGVDPQAQPVSSGAPQAMIQGPHGAQVPYSGMQQHQQQQQQQFSAPPMNPAMPKTSMEGAPGAPTGDVIQPLQSIPAEKITKKPIPDEHLVLKTTFEGLIQKCLAVATDPQTKRKLDEANKRLEALYDKLREQTLSPAIIGGLHNIARSIESRSYTEGLNIHTHIVSNSNFSETSAFMPVLKVVLTQANKLGV
ncbi:Protein transport protein Sec31A [Larimichthys crocea]|uniref:Uncharacterized protein n=1 Tax=Larimichthys crocea TaxID=215358 RepID=A0ACD3QNU3_LARCR|nr:Protein transport protein Sec31A [Larimichthys crocea]